MCICVFCVHSSAVETTHWSMSTQTHTHNVTNSLPRSLVRMHFPAFSLSLSLPLARPRSLPFACSLVLSLALSFSCSLFLLLSLSLALSNSCSLFLRTRLDCTVKTSMSAETPTRAIWTSLPHSARLRVKTQQDPFGATIHPQIHHRSRVSLALLAPLQLANFQVCAVVWLRYMRYVMSPFNQQGHM